MSSVKIASVCMHAEMDKAANLRRILEWMEEAARAGAALVVFPEQILSGYLYNCRCLYNEQFVYQYANAECVPEGPSVQKIVTRAMELGIYVIFGMTERDRREPDILYNTAVLTGPEGYIGKYRKVHLPMDELHIYTPGTEFPVFETGIGRIGLMICYDKSFPEAARSMVLDGAQILVCPTAWGIRHPEKMDLEHDEARLLNDLYDQVRATENMVYYVSSNQVFQTKEAWYCGHSAIYSPAGERLAGTGFREGICWADVDVEDGITKARYLAHNGNRPIRERRPQAYRGLYRFMRKERTDEENQDRCDWLR